MQQRQPTSTIMTVTERHRCFRYLPSFLTPSVLAILLTECAERFSYFGFRAVLVLYFHLALGYDETTSVALFAYVSCAAYLAPIFGAIVADAFLGRYTTILWFGVTYFAGLVMMTIGAYLPGLDDGDNDEANRNTESDVSDDNKSLIIKKLCTLIGLALACLGTGGIKPCVSAFGADQVNVSNEHEAEVTKPQCDDRGEMVHLEVIGKSASIVSDQESVQQDDVRSFFSYFYFCINVGALLSIGIVPIIRGHFGFGAAFLAPTLFLCFAMIVFVSRRASYKMHKPTSGVNSSGQDGSLYTTFLVFLRLLSEEVHKSEMFACFPCRKTTQHRRLQNVTVIGGDQSVYIDQKSESREEGDNVQTSAAASWDDAATATSSPDISFHNNLREQFSAQQVEDAEAVLHITPILSLLPIFWMLYDQQGSVWTLQATRMELHGLQPEQLNIINPVEIMLFIPIFEKIIYPSLENRAWNISHLRRMSAGMVLTAISFLVSGLLESTMQHREDTGGEKISVFWQIPQITILACGEILVSVTGLEFSYSCSPERMKAFIMALYLLTTAAGDFLGGLLYSSIFKALSRTLAMYVCALLMIVNLVIFRRVARWWETTKNCAKDKKSTTQSLGQDGANDVSRNIIGLQTVSLRKSALSSQSSSGSDYVALKGGERGSVEMTSIIREIT